nr:MAG TPA: major capsid protein [Caudoviricetes sp.]
MIDSIKKDDATAAEAKETKEETSENNIAKNIDNDNDHLEDLKKDEEFDKEKGNKEFEDADKEHADKLEKDMHEDKTDVEDLKEDLEELKNKKEKRSLGGAKGEEKMEKIINGAETEVKQTEMRGFLNYLRSKQTGSLPETRALPANLEGMTSAAGSAIIPEEIITKARVLPETIVDLRTKVMTQKVNHAVGQYPILKANKAVLASTEELLKNPDLENPQFETVDYKVVTYRGQLAVAQEALEDSDDDLAAIISRHIQRQALNTANAKIAEVLRSAEALAATSIDDIKTAINTGFDPAYRLEFLVSQSFFNAIDLMKDAEGRYLLQPSVTAASGRMFLGLDVTVLADEVIGTKKGDKVAFLGQPDAFATFFDRVDTSVRWVENMYYGQVLAVAMRFDAKKVDGAAGKFITLSDAVTPEP